MFKCSDCGFVTPNEKARFCGKCGAAKVDSDSVDPLADKLKEWETDDIDQPKLVTQYVSMLSEFYFDSNNIADVHKFSVRIRERLKISFDTHTNALSTLAEQKRAIAHLANFRIEFNENVIDAYAGHDTFLNFRYTNLSEDDLFKVNLFWDDPDTTERIDLRAETKNFVKPMTSVTIGASAIFDRIGIKELSDFQITITDQFGESASFRAEPFSFKVANHDQKITQNISTHNQISIEGRGVVDASGMGSDKPALQNESSDQRIWRELSFSYLPPVKAQPSTAQKEEPKTGVGQKLGTVTTAKTTNFEFDKDNLLSVLNAAEQGNPEAQKTLGNMYRDGKGVATNHEQAVHWFRKAAEQGYAAGQTNLGVMYENGLAVTQSDEQALYWYRKGAEQGDADGQNNLGTMYEYGRGVLKNDEQAVNWYRKAAEQGYALGQSNLGAMYQNGEGVAQNYEKATYWFQKAAEQGDAHGQINFGIMYENGKGVAQSIEQAAYWYRKAAEQGFALGQFALGDMYENGKGVAQSIEQAAYWYRKAAEQGNENAIESLKELESTGAATVPPTDGYGSWNYDNYTYTGMFKNGLCNGLGELIWSVDRLGHRYVGNFVNGLQHGQGTYTFPDGANLVGIFENNVLNDHNAHLDFADGGTYDGPMVNGIMSGLGTRIFGGEDVGHSYTGNFENNLFNGEGTYSFPDGTTNVGQFKDGVFVPPIANEQDGDYFGPSSNGLPNGVGKMIMSNGDVYKGDFVNGRRHGLGELTYANGTEVLGRFENNELVKNASFTESVKIGFKTGNL